MGIRQRTRIWGAVSLTLAFGWAFVSATQAVAKPGGSSTTRTTKKPKKPSAKKKATKKVTKKSTRKSQKVARKPSTTRHRRLAFASGYNPPPREFHVNEGDLPAPVANATCPAEMANIENRYCVDRWEGSLVEVTGDKSEQLWSPFETLPDGVFVKAVSKANVHPQGYISGAQAQAACDAAGKRLCSPLEWRKACGGSRGVQWSYAGQREPDRCNDRGKSPMLHFYPQVNVSWKLVGMLEMNDPQLNQMEGALAKTGQFEECMNDYGVHDMVGNLHEWTSDPNGTFQGGYYLDTHINGDGCGYRTTAHEFTYHDYSTGFRCCKDAEEGSEDATDFESDAGASSGDE